MRREERHRSDSPSGYIEDYNDEPTHFRRRGRGASGGGSGRGPFGFGPRAGKLVWVFGILMALFCVVAARLFYLQVIDAENLSTEAEARRTNSQVIEAKRGTIYDRNGNVLATSVECYDIYCNPQEVNSPAAVALILEEAFSGEAATYKEQMTQDTTFVYLVRKADKDKAEQVAQELEDKGYTGIYFLKQSKRVYPYGSVAGQIIGMVDVDNNGLTGLELQYDEQLSGTDGEMIMETGATGTPIAGGVSETVEPEDGQDIVLALDIDIQKKVEEEITAGVKKYDAEGGLCMVTDPSTGEILAACSTPLADISDPSSVTNEGLNLKMVTSAYEPGSIVKIFTIATGIEDGLFDTDTEFEVPSTILVGSDTVHDDDGRSYTMTMTPREILRRSSNVGASMLAQEVIGAERFSEGLAKFQLGMKTGIDYPGETAGTVKSLDEYESYSLGSMAFGQGLAVPMVQIVKGVGAISQGGWLQTPHFVTKVGGEDLEWDSPGQAVSEETATKMTDMLKDVFSEGTAVAGQVEGYEIAGKTGTGEQADENGYIDGKYLSSLVGFAPADDAQVLVYVGLYETPYLASGSAAPIFSSIMSEALTDLDIKPSS